MEGQSVAFLLLAAALPCLAQLDPAALLRQMADAEKRNRHAAAYFVYREDIRSAIANQGRPSRQTAWITYEVTFLAGQGLPPPGGSRRQAPLSRTAGN